jgi:hypothetical protein
MAAMIEKFLEELQVQIWRCLIRIKKGNPVSVRVFFPWPIRFFFSVKNLLGEISLGCQDRTGAQTLENRSKREAAFFAAPPLPNKKTHRPVADEFFRIGRRQATVYEQPDAIKTYLVRWNGVKVDLTQLAKLRWIEKMKTPDLCKVFGIRRTAIRQHLRTLRKSGISQLNLTKSEAKLVRNQIELEEQKYGGSYE